MMYFQGFRLLLHKILLFAKKMRMLRKLGLILAKQATKVDYHLRESALFGYSGVAIQIRDEMMISNSMER